MDTMLATIESLPRISTNMFTPKYEIYCLDDYSVHVTKEIRDALLARGYIPVLLGGGITGDIQVNDTHQHHRLKTEYRKRETQLMMEQLRDNPNKIPSPSRDDMMAMLSRSYEYVTSDQVDVQQALKQNFITNALDGSEDNLVNDKLFQMVGERIVAFRENHIKTPPPRNIKELMKTITCQRVSRSQLGSVCQTWDMSC